MFGLYQTKNSTLLKTQIAAEGECDIVLEMGGY